MTRLIRFLSLTLQFMLVFIVAGIVGVWLAGKYGYIQPLKPYVVLSGSMEPSIPTGAVVVVSPKVFGYAPGDVITFGKSQKDTITHRIVSLIDDNGAIAYQIKGDANDNLDAAIVKPDSIVGSVMFAVPYIGYLADVAKKPQGFILLVIVPATIIVYEELRFLKNETARQVAKMRRQATSDKPKTSKLPVTSDKEQDLPNYQPVPVVAPVQTQQVKTVHRPPSTKTYLGKAPLPPRGHPLEQLFKLLPPASAFTASITNTSAPRPTATSRSAPVRIVAAPVRSTGFDRHWLVIPAIAVTTIFVGVTGSYFMDTETSIGNILGAAESFATPEVSLTPTPPPEQPPQLLETLTLDSAQAAGVTSTTSLTSGQNYRVEISGTWTNRGGTDTVDADFTSYDAFATPGLDGDPAWTAFGLIDYWNLLDVQVDNNFIDWGAYKPTHTYAHTLVGSGNPITLRVFDGIPETNTIDPSWYADNAGSLTIKIYQLP